MTSPSGLPRLLAGFDAAGGAMTLGAHERPTGRCRPEARRADRRGRRSGLRGRGGADFPTARKLQTLADARRVSAVVVNGSETEPASRKDRTLLQRAPHLVLDGALLAAQAIGARTVIIKVGDGAAGTIASLEGAIAVRDSGKIEISMSRGPQGYVTGEESAVMAHLNGGPSLPTFTPPRPFERGYRGRPTLIHNPETLAQLALIARHGERWYREPAPGRIPGRRSSRSPVRSPTQAYTSWRSERRWSR